MPIGTESSNTSVFSSLSLKLLKDLLFWAISNVLSPFCLPLPEKTYENGAIEDVKARAFRAKTRGQALPERLALRGRQVQSPAP